MMKRAYLAIAFAFLGISCTTVIAAAQKPKPVLPKPNPPPAVPAALASKAKLTLITRETNHALGLVAAPDEPTGRLFVVEKGGTIRILRGSTFDPVPFLDVTARVTQSPPNQFDSSEQGLLGLAFHPQFSRNGRFYINYTAPSRDTHVIELRVDKGNPNRADTKTERSMLVVEQPYSNHNGGNLAFGPDGKLYVGLGDGGSGDDPHGYGQNPNTRLGKFLRIEVDKVNPVVEVIDKGLRNPWRYSFDRKTGDLYIADVGQNTYEYIHVLPAGRLTGHNLGWNITEGLHCFQNKPCDRKGLTPPVIEYSHSEGCSITGGYVYRGKALPEFQGIYFFTDFCTGILRSFRMTAQGELTDSWDWKQALDPETKLARLAAFGEDQDGEVYLVSHEGPIYKLVRR